MCVILLKKTQWNCFWKLSSKCVVGNIKFWKSEKSSISDKSNNCKGITLVENEQIVSHDIEVDYFSSVIKNLKLQPSKTSVDRYCQGENPIFQAILKYQDHPSITAIKDIN